MQPRKDRSNSLWTPIQRRGLLALMRNTRRLLMGCSLNAYLFLLSCPTTTRSMPKVGSGPMFSRESAHKLYKSAKVLRCHGGAGYWLRLWWMAPASVRVSSSLELKIKSLHCHFLAINRPKFESGHNMFLSIFLRLCNALVEQFYLFAPV